MQPNVKHIQPALVNKIVRSGWGTPGIPRGGHFSLQDPKNSRKLLEAIIGESRAVAREKGIENRGYENCRFYAKHARFFGHCPARCVNGHRYVDLDIVHNLETAGGIMLERHVSRRGSCD